MPEWKRSNSQLNSSDEELIENWSYQDDNGAKIFEGYLRYFFCTWGTTIQLAIMKKPNLNQSKEPDMSEKLFIMNGLRVYNKITDIAFEVYPRKKKIVDKYDLYHVWILDKMFFPYLVKFRKNKLNFFWKKVIINGKHLCYKKKTIIGQKIKVYFLKAEDRKELTWYEKQDFKDFVIGKDIIALESIEKSTDNVAYLVCLPNEIGELPFGLRN